LLTISVATWQVHLLDPISSHNLASGMVMPMGGGHRRTVDGDRHDFADARVSRKGSAFAA
jgi:hypothetical protein